MLFRSVDVVEPLGDRMDVYLTSKSDRRFIANIAPHIEIKVDDVVTMYIDIERVHIFEPGEMGRNISLAT